MRAALLIPALRTSTSNRSPTMECTCLASSTAPFGVPRSAEIALLVRPSFGFLRRETPLPGWTGRSGLKHRHLSQQVPTQWLFQFRGKPPSPVQFCCAEPFLPPPLHQLLSRLFGALAPLVVLRGPYWFPPETRALMSCHRRTGFGRLSQRVVKILYRPETPARLSCYRDKSGHVDPVPKRISVRAW
jgi:hypothetical protein